MGIKKINALILIMIGAFFLCRPVFSQAFADKKSWTQNHHGVSILLMQIDSQHLQAFYLARGFTLEQIQNYVHSCVYMTVLKNNHAPGVVHVNTRQWRAVNIAEKNHQPPISTSTWLAELKKNNSKKSALIAFRWAQFPAQQSYQPGGDWNQGMLSFAIKSGTQFDLQVIWDVEGKKDIAIIKGIQCQ